MIFAHLGGIDEIGVLLVPAVIAILTLRWADKRAQARAEEFDRHEAAKEPSDDVPIVEQPKAHDSGLDVSGSS